MHKILNFNYEALTEKPKEKTKELLDFCELEWDKNCLNFFNNKRVITTVSFAQVRSPIYKSSVNSNMGYSKYLQEMFNILDTN